MARVELRDEIEQAIVRKAITGQPAHDILYDVSWELYGVLTCNAVDTAFTRVCEADIIYRVPPGVYRTDWRSEDVNRMYREV